MSDESLQTEETAASTTAETVTAAATVEQLIYVGPNISKERLNKFAIFKNGLPQHMDDVFTACPAIKKLFVSIDKLSDILEKINKTGTAYNAWYSQVTAYIKKGVK